MGLFHFIFRRMCYHIFKHVDVDNSGFVEAMEVEVAIYRLYNIINKRLPGWQDPPSRKEILAKMKEYDTRGDLRLSRDEFVPFARSLVKNGPDMFFSRVGRDAVVNTGILPLATQGLKRGFRESGWERGANTPLAILAPAVGITFRAIKALLPAGLSK